MRFLCFLDFITILLICSPLNATCPYCSFGPCQFIRGDSNCDGAVNNADMSRILSNPANLDAADVNDDGIVDAADINYLYQYLYQGGPPPACPFPSPGLDCTGDTLEPGCSPPSSASSGGDSVISTSVLGSSYELLEDGIEDWAYPLCTSPSSCDVHDHLEFTGGGIEITHEDFLICFEKPSTKRDTWRATFKMIDLLGFSKHRVLSGVQTISLTIDGAALDKSAKDKCQEYPCSLDLVTVNFSMSNCRFYIKLKDNPEFIECFPWSTPPETTQHWIHGLTSFCTPFSSEWGANPITFSIDTDSILDAVPAACDVAYIDQIRVENFYVEAVWDGEPPYSEVMRKIKITPTLTYQWCECN